MPKEYRIPTETIFYQEDIKKSKFIVHIAHTPDLESAKAFIQEVGIKYPDARHNCWAHVAGEPGGSHVLGFSDDGEPNGTAGKPMLNVLMGSGIGEITAVITRYFGGIKLGTGGLVRAYGGSLNNAMLELKTAIKIPEAIIYGISEYSQQGLIENILSGYQVLDIKKNFTAQIDWQIKIDSRETKLALAEVFEKTNARVEFKLKE
ncbi:YigZ family protein [Pseudoalteromonas denitrificans]|uniref:Uncharacterized protein, YigZ family n=1 Tax=Pseudoalteromonas denitrificans DSM 6059 TaxID=1123010 RepID=A0A1I1JU72_9GAMM|nr:YigZ family protein [Pseudoalteromonas denitrificans]SFC50038.1 uncharacterized protein, YigZ family [Pseudoalteromonas denitrificans DSM 6059]